MGLGLAAVLLLAACSDAASSSAPAGGLAAVIGMQRVTSALPTPQLAGDLPLSLYVGADYCPFCASMRWPLVRALSRFRNFAGLGRRQSTGGVDGFPSQATYDFSHTTFTSAYVAFQMVETADADGNPLQQPSVTQASLINRFDPSGSIPFVFVGGRYVARLPYSPSLLEGRIFDQIQRDVDSPGPDPLGQAINQEADVITALICSSDHVQPAVVCGTPQVQQQVRTIPQ